MLALVWARALELASASESELALVLARAWALASEAESASVSELVLALDLELAWGPGWGSPGAPTLVCALQSA